MQIADMHCDTISRLFNLEKRQNDEKRNSGAVLRKEDLNENTGHLDLKRMEESNYLIQNFAMFVQLGKVQNPWERVCALYRYYLEQMEKYKEKIVPLLQISDLEKKENQGKLFSLLTVEEGAVCEGKIERLQTLFDMGVRMMTLTWNYPNELGAPNINLVSSDIDIHRPDTMHGLTKTGKEFVAEMERLGMIPDVSHLSDAGFYDVLEVTRKPFVASHSNARAECPCVRNMTDDMIRKLADRGGVMGLNFCADFLEETPKGVKNPGKLAAVVRHTKHILNVGGEEVLGLGSDFDGIDTNEELPGAQAMEKLWWALRDSGITPRQLDALFCGNVLRLYREILC